MPKRRYLDLGLRLLCARKAMKLTISQASQASAVPPSTLSRWERGLDEPSLKALASLARLYGGQIKEWKDVAEALLKVGIGQNAPTLQNTDHPTAPTAC